jgi:hypothetical protein
VQLPGSDQTRSAEGFFAVTFFAIKLRSQNVLGGPLDDNAGKEENASESYSEDYR